MKTFLLLASSSLLLASHSAPLIKVGEAEVGFRMHLGVMRSSGMDISNEDFDSLVAVTNGPTVTATWKGHPLFGEGFTATATFVERDGGWEYSFRWSGIDRWKFFVENVSFPDLVVPRTDKSGVLYPRNHGMGMIRRPEWKKWGWETEPFVSEGMREFQFTALLDDETGGWYLDARDPIARYKRCYAYCRVGLDDPHARLGIVWDVPMTVAQTVSGELPWKGIIRPFRGGWWDAAQIYKPWALGQSWTKAAKARCGEPAFRKLRDICFWAWNRGGCDLVAKPVERFAADSGLPCALHWDWWHRYAKDVGYPTYWPPYEGVEKFNRTIDDLHKAGCYAMVYVNGMSRDRDDASWGKDGEKDAQYEHDGTIHGHHWNPHTFEPHRLTTVCGEGVGFQKLIEGVIANLRASKLDAVYLDQVSCAAAKPCWSPYHRHPKGDSVGSLMGYHSYLQEARALNPGVHLGSEEVSEAFLPDFDVFISLFGTSYERCGLGVLPEKEAVPVWNALYHGLAAVFGSYLLIDGVTPWDDDRWPAERKWKTEDQPDWEKLFPDQFAVEFARTFAWGNQPTVHAFRMEHATNPKFAAKYRFMLDVARFYAANRDFLFDGELLAPGKLTCATKDVDFQRRGIYHAAGKYETVRTKDLPTVFHNVWKNAAGETAAILVNWSREPQPWSLETPDGRASGTLAPFSCAKAELMLR